MALTTCPDCGQKVSTAAPACPTCGRRMKRARGPAGSVVRVGGCLLMMVSLAAVLLGLYLAMPLFILGVVILIVGELM